MYMSNQYIHLSPVSPNNMSSEVVGSLFGPWVINGKDEKAVFDPGSQITRGEPQV